MGDVEISLLEFALALRDKVAPKLDRIHPSGANCIHCWLADMLDAAHEGEAREIKRLAGLVQHKLRDERLWHIRKQLDGRRYHPRIAAWVHEELGY